MGIGAIVGGALKGYGDGMAEMARSREDERRQAALINLKAEKDQAQTKVTADLQDRNAGNQAVYDNWVGAESDGRKAGIQEQTDKRRYGQELTLARIQFENEKSLALFKSQRNISEAEEASARAIEAEATKANTYIDRYEIDRNGNLVGITVTGKTIPIPVQPKPKPAAQNSSSSLVDSKGSGTPAPAPSKNVSATGSPPPKRTDSNW